MDEQENPQVPRKKRKKSASNQQDNLLEARLKDLEARLMESAEEQKKLTQALLASKAESDTLKGNVAQLAQAHNTLVQNLPQNLEEAIKSAVEQGRQLQAQRGGQAPPKTPAAAALAEDPGDEGSTGNTAVDMVRAIMHELLGNAKSVADLVTAFRGPQANGLNIQSYVMGLNHGEKLIKGQLNMSGLASELLGGPAAANTGIGQTAPQ